MTKIIHQIIHILGWHKGRVYTELRDDEVWLGFQCGYCGKIEDLHCVDDTTISNQKYEEWEINEFIDFVYNAKSENEAVDNIKVILKQYKKRISTWELLGLLFKK